MTDIEIVLKKRGASYLACNRTVENFQKIRVIIDERQCAYSVYYRRNDLTEARRSDWKQIEL